MSFLPLHSESSRQDEDEPETSPPYDSSRLWTTLDGDGDLILKKMNSILTSLQGTINGILGRAVGRISVIKIDKFVSFPSVFSLLFLVDII